MYLFLKQTKIQDSKSIMKTKINSLKIQSFASIKVFKPPKSQKNFFHNVLTMLKKSLII